MIKNFIKGNSGMTLVELMVVLSIFAIISMTVAFNYSSYRSVTSTSVLSQDVALSIREAQGYAMGVRSVYIDDDNGSIFPAYGIRFNTVNNMADISGNQKSSVLFVDIPCNLNNPNDKGNTQYDHPGADNCGGFNPSADTSAASCGLNLGPGSECLSISNISGPDKFAGICLGDNCSLYDGTNPGILESGTLDVVFRRPNPDASFCFKVPGGNDCEGSQSSAGIIVQSEADPSVYKKIIVWNTGQISIE
jgi:prepilin-type N-terminal cleavage/methylation domain-containing protein